MEDRGIQAGGRRRGRKYSRNESKIYRKGVGVGIGIATRKCEAEKRQSRIVQQRAQSGAVREAEIQAERKGEVRGAVRGTLKGSIKGIRIGKEQTSNKLLLGKNMTLADINKLTKNQLKDIMRRRYENGISRSKPSKLFKSKDKLKKELIADLRYYNEFGN